MSESDADIIRQYYRKYGGVGSYSTAQKLKTALHNDGYKINLKNIRQVLAQLPEYSRFRTTSKGLPKHVSQRFSLVSGPNQWIFGDCMSVTSQYFAISTRFVYCSIICKERMAWSL